MTTPSYTYSTELAIFFRVRNGEIFDTKCMAGPRATDRCGLLVEPSADELGDMPLGDYLKQEYEKGGHSIWLELDRTVTITGNKILSVPRLDPLADILPTEASRTEASSTEDSEEEGVDRWKGDSDSDDDIPW